MSQQADREGNFRASILIYGLKEAESGALSVSFRVKLWEFWDGESWQPWEQYDMEADGDTWIVKKDGTVNQPGAESLMKYAGWDGNFDTIANETWEPTRFQVLVKKDEYKGAVRFKVAFLNDWDRTPGGMSNIGTTRVKELQAKFGAPLRAIAGNVRRGTTPANGRPVAPPPMAPTALAPPPSSDKDIPF